MDKRLEKIGSDEALALRGKAAVANARLAFERFERVFGGERFKALAEAGARRPASAVGVDRREERGLRRHALRRRPRDLRGRQHDAGEDDARPSPTTARSTGDQVRDHYDEAREVMDALGELGIEYDDVIETLEREGVEKFVASWHELVGTVEEQMEASRR